MAESKFMTNFAPAFRKTMDVFLFGALDEWLSQRSAKPSTAVRIRQAPRKEREFKKREHCGALFSFLRQFYYASSPKRLLISAISSSSNHLERRFLAWSMMAGSISVRTFFST